MMQPSTLRNPLPASRHHEVALADYRAQRAAALAQFAATNRIQPLWRALTRATDMLLAQVAAHAEVTLVAVGGYGRGELFPFSDVDVLVLVPEGARGAADGAVAQVLQQVWDMNIPVSHATRSLDETIMAAQNDSTITAALMDARLISGERGSFLALKKTAARGSVRPNPARICGG